MEKRSRTVAENKKAFHDYFILERMEAGIVLSGTEIKSIRMSNVNLKDSYAKIEKGEIWLHNMHIGPYKHGNVYNHEPLRKRKLLLKKMEIMKLVGKTQEKGYSIVALNVHWVGDWAKIELGLAKGKKDYDKRDSIKTKEHNREMERAMKKFV